MIPASRRVCRTRTNLLIALIASTAIFVTPVPMPAQAWGVAPAIKVLHASPGTGRVDVYVDAIKLATLDYTQFSGSIAVLAGTRTIRFFPENNTTTPLLQFSSPFENNKTYVVVMAGQAGQPLQPVVLTDLPIPKYRYFRYRVVNLAPGSPPFDLINTRGRLLIDNIAFTTNKFVTLPSYAGQYHFQLRISGQPTPFRTLPPQSFASRGRYTLWVFSVQPQAAAVAAQAAPETVAPKILQAEPGVFTVTQD